MKYSADIFDACIARVHAQILHEKALQCKPLPDFSPERAAQRRQLHSDTKKAKWIANMKAKGVGR